MADLAPAPAMTGRPDYRSLALSVLQTAVCGAKASAARSARIALAETGPRELELGPTITLPDRPARPETPKLVSPGDVPKRKFGSLAGRAGLLHALAHIEFNAIDLAFDMAARFAPEIAEAGLDPRDFVADWFSVGDDEARHFNLVRARLGELGSDYGDLPAHDGLWQAAQETSDSALARLAIAPMVLEARGLDVTPGMIDRLKDAGDTQSANVLQIILDEEVGHVALGVKWFEALCASRGLDSKDTFQCLVSERFRGLLKPPFNHEARANAGLGKDFYDELAG